MVSSVKSLIVLVVFSKQSAASVEALYTFVLEIAKKKAHTIGEDSIKPCLLKVVKLILREASEKEMQRYSSNNTVTRQIFYMSADFKKFWIRSKLLHCSHLRQTNQIM